MDELLDIIAFGGFEDIEDVLTIGSMGPTINMPRNRAREYERLNFEQMTPEAIKLEFRFDKSDLERLATALEIPQEIRTTRRHTAKGIEALCICLRRLAYPNRFYDLEKMFGLSAQSLSDITDIILTHIYEKFGHLLVDQRSHRWLTNAKLRRYSQAVEAMDAPLLNCWGFIDGTARAICRPSINQQEYFSGHKRMHCVKYQSVLCPDGIIVSLFGAYPGRRHDAGILRDSNLYAQLEQCCTFDNGDRFVLYGDPAYGIQELLISPFRNRNLTEQQQLFNTGMSSGRQAVDWGFGKIIQQFAFLDFKKNRKLLLQDISKMYAVGTILTNCHTCLYGSQTSHYFNVAPPQLEEYLSIN